MKLNGIIRIFWILFLFLFVSIPVAFAQTETSQPTESTFYKKPAEEYFRAFEYFSRLPFGATLTSGALSAYNVTDSEDATGDVLQSTSATIVGTQARIGLEAGEVGKTYRIICRVTLSDGSILEDSFLMIVY